MAKTLRRHQKAGVRVRRRSIRGNTFTPRKLSDILGRTFASCGDSLPPGVLLHPTSLPGAYGIGAIGAEALRFVDWLVTAGMQVGAAC